MRKDHRAPQLEAFDLAFSAIATLVPILLTVFAFAALPDSMERARMIVQGFEWIVGILGCALALRVAYLFGVRRGSTLQHAAPARVNGMHMA